MYIEVLSFLRQRLIQFVQVNCHRGSTQGEDTGPVHLNVLQPVITTYTENCSASGQNSPMCPSVGDGRLNVGVHEDVLGNS